MNTILVPGLFLLANVYVVLGYYAFTKRTGSHVHRVYLSISIVFAAWSLAALVRNTLTAPETILIWRSVSVFTWSMGTALILHFVLALIREHESRSLPAALFLFIYGPAIILLVGNVVFTLIPFLRFGTARSAGTGSVRLLFGPIGATTFYLLYVTIAIVFLYRWGARSQKQRTKTQAWLVGSTLAVTTSLIVLYGTIAPTFVDFVLPFVTPVFPLVWVIGMHIAITRYQLMEVDLTIAMDGIMNSVLDIVVLTDSHGTIVGANHRTWDLLGYRASELKGTDVGNLVEHIPGNTSDHFDTTLSTADGRSIPVRVRMTSVPASSGQTIGHVIAAQDLRLERKFQKLSITDALTGVSNRLHLDTVLVGELKRASRTNQFCSVVLFDIDDFKRVNDRYGHQKGDEILVTLANTVRGRLRETDTCGRWGGEEFLLILPDTHGSRAQILVEGLRRQIETTDSQMGGGITCSFGISFFDPASTTDYHVKEEDITDLASKLVGAADDALYKAKLHGKNRVVLADQ